jgi:hypothetical protein
MAVMKPTETDRPLDPTTSSGDRFVLLEHTGHPEDPVGRHYDLLLEEVDACQTWRLAEIPTPGGLPVSAMLLPPHRVAWLDTEAAEVSGGRGFARRIDAGHYARLPLAAVDDPTLTVIHLTGSRLFGTLEIRSNGCAGFRPVA